MMYILNTQAKQFFRLILTVHLTFFTKNVIVEAQLLKQLPWMTSYIADDDCSMEPDDIPGATQTCIEPPVDTGMRERCFYTYIPECASEDSPVVFQLQSSNRCPSAAFKYEGWKEQADENCFVVVLPVPNIRRWISRFTCWATPAGLENLEPEPEFPTKQCCCISCYSALMGTGFLIDPDVTKDDLFIRLVASYVVRDVPLSTDGAVTIDTKRIYFGGHSNGCMMAQAMAMLHSDLVAAVACHSGPLLTPASASYDPTPMWNAQGKIDIFSYDGEVRPEFNLNVKFPSMDARFEYLSGLNGCSSYENKTLTGFSDEGFIQTASNCTNNATVEFVTLNDVGHYPFPNYDENNEGSNLDSPNLYPLIDYESTKAAWEFVSNHELNEEPELMDI